MRVPNICETHVDKNIEAKERISSFSKIFIFDKDFQIFVEVLASRLNTNSIIILKKYNIASYVMTI